jgi:hypothetical protein
MRETPLKPLDTATFLDGRARWRGSFFPGAGELSGSVRLRGQPRATVTPSGANDRCYESDRVHRASRNVRRFVVSNCLSSFVTLTFAQEPSPDEALDEVSLAFRRCRERNGAFPFVWTLERGEHCRRVHAHALVSPSYAALLNSRWHEGTINIKDVGDDFESLRTGAGYLAKSFSEGPIAGNRLYRVATGFAPEMVLIEADSPSELVAEATHQMGDAPVHESASALAVSATWSR